MDDETITGCIVMGGGCLVLLIVLCLLTLLVAFTVKAVMWVFA